MNFNNWCFAIVSRLVIIHWFHLERTCYDWYIAIEIQFLLVLPKHNFRVVKSFQVFRKKIFIRINVFRISLANFFKSWNINKNFHIVEAAALKTRLKILDFFLKKVLLSFLLLLFRYYSISLFNAWFVNFIPFLALRNRHWLERKKNNFSASLLSWLFRLPLSWRSNLNVFNCKSKCQLFSCLFFRWKEICNF